MADSNSELKATINPIAEEAKNVKTDTEKIIKGIEIALSAIDKIAAKINKIEKDVEEIKNNQK